MNESMTTTEGSKKIYPIQKESIHKICSGQVVFDLAGAVKELVENSLDSGASCIEIKLFDYGKSCITVVDNGTGVQESDFENLGLKYHTSKLKNFSDLLEIETLGFRGEALSSLCALSNLNIITRHHTSQYAFKLEFDKNGTLVNKKECARQIGTTVSASNIFKNLPVRFQEFERNLKKEFSKMIKVLHGYCLVSTGVKIVCTSIKGNKSTILFSTYGSKNVLNNINSIFGSKVCKSLIEVKALSPDEEILNEYNLPAKIPNNLTWECYVSSCCHTQGRSAPDKQFIYVNGRPCDLGKISKLINFIYHKYNNKQYPFVYLNFQLDKCFIDFNVTPDKRTIFFTQEQIIFAMIKSNFDKVWKSMQGIFITKTAMESSDRDYKRKYIEPLENSPLPKKPFVVKMNNESSSVHTETETITMKLDKFYFNKMKINFKETNIIYDKLVETASVIKGKTLKTNLSITNDRRCMEPSMNIKNKSIDCVNKKECIQKKIPEVNMFINLDLIKETLDKKKKMLESKQKSKSVLKYRTNWNSTAEKVEKDLEKQLTQECFAQMQIIGQFNLGFILTKLGNDIFIIDQHASDEKFRFEKLLNQTKLKTQKLLLPKLLNLSITNETTLIENEHIFKDNGFSFSIKINDSPGQRVKLTGMPVSYGWKFEKEDIEELIFLINEGGVDGTGSNVIPRPSRVQHMLASRACRGAVMIGTALNLSEMRRLIRQLSQIDSPWNCPHGRPTFRHLISIVSK